MGGAVSEATVSQCALVGLPGLPVPTGVVDGLPMGVQIADKVREDLCFEAGEAIERAAGIGTPIDKRS
jgi:amidase